MPSSFRSALPWQRPQRARASIPVDQPMIDAPMNATVGRMFCCSDEKIDIHMVNINEQLKKILIHIWIACVKYVPKISQNHSQCLTLDFLVLMGSAVELNSFGSIEPSAQDIVASLYPKLQITRPKFSTRNKIISMDLIKMNRA